MDRRVKPGNDDETGWSLNSWFNEIQLWRRAMRQSLMDVALEEARAAAAAGEVPVGCVIVRGGEVIAARGQPHARRP